jgi:hypothetical protein
MEENVMSTYHKNRRNGPAEMMPFGPSPDWYQAYWMTDRPASLHLKLPYAAATSLLAIFVALPYAAAASLLAILVAWIV